MPLVKRAVEPYHVSRVAVPAKVDDPLECIVVFTLSNVLRQLASLSKHAEDLLGEVFSEARSYVERTSRLKERVNRLAVQVKELDAETEGGEATPSKMMILNSQTLHQLLHQARPKLIAKLTPGTAAKGFFRSTFRLSRRSIHQCFFSSLYIRS